MVVLPQSIGTGKTTTLCEIILQTYSEVRDSKILIATPSNVAANVIAETLLKHKAFRKASVVRLFSRHAANNSEIPDSIVDYSAVLVDNLQSTRGRLPIVYLNGIQKFSVVVTTCQLLGCLQMRRNLGLEYSHVFIDEAGQCTEPVSLIPIGFSGGNGRSGQQIVMAGDPKQLGPVVYSQPARKRNFGCSLLARLLSAAPYLEDVSEFDKRLIEYLYVSTKFSRPDCYLCMGRVWDRKRAYHIILLKMWLS